MAALIALGSIVLILIVLIDAFETMLLPRQGQTSVPVHPRVLRLLLGSLGRDGPADSIR